MLLNNLHNSPSSFYCQIGSLNVPVNLQGYNQLTFPIFFLLFYLLKSAEYDYTSSGQDEIGDFLFFNPSFLAVASIDFFVLLGNPFNSSSSKITG